MFARKVSGSGPRVRQGLRHVSRGLRDWVPCPSARAAKAPSTWCFVPGARWWPAGAPTPTYPLDMSSTYRFWPAGDAPPLLNPPPPPPGLPVPLAGLFDEDHREASQPVASLPLLLEEPALHAVHDVLLAPPPLHEAEDHQPLLADPVPHAVHAAQDDPQQADANRDDEEEGHAVQDDPLLASSTGSGRSSHQFTAKAVAPGLCPLLQQVVHARKTASTRMRTT